MTLTFCFLSYCWMYQSALRYLEFSVWWGSIQIKLAAEDTKKSHFGSRMRRREIKTNQNNLLSALDTRADSVFPVISWLLLWLSPKKGEEESPWSLGLNLESGQRMSSGNVMEWLRSGQEPQMCTCLFVWLTSLWQPWLYDTDLTVTGRYR